MSLGQMDDYSLSDLAGSTAIILASCGGLITIILSSRCDCSVNCCWWFKCHRTPPPEPNEPEVVVKEKETETETEQEPSLLPDQP